MPDTHAARLLARATPRPSLWHRLAHVWGAFHADLHTVRLDDGSPLYVLVCATCGHLEPYALRRDDRAPWPVVEIPAAQDAPPD